MFICLKEGRYQYISMMVIGDTSGIDGYDKRKKREDKNCLMLYPTGNKTPPV